VGDLSKLPANNIEVGNLIRAKAIVTCVRNAIDAEETVKFLQMLGLIDADMNPITERGTSMDDPHNFNGPLKRKPKPPGRGTAWGA
jgi:hypothetical protein